MVSKQNKQNLIERAEKLVKNIKNLTGYRINMILTGSMAKGHNPSVNKDGQYDIDLDLLAANYEDDANVTANKIMKALRESLRVQETWGSGTRVKYILVNENGHNYKFDLAFKKAKANIPTHTLVKAESGYKWVLDKK